MVTGTKPELRGAKGVLDGEYLDSMESWGNVLDYNPESLRVSTAPPTFASESFRPVLPDEQPPVVPPEQSLDVRPRQPHRHEHPRRQVGPGADRNGSGG